MTTYESALTIDFGEVGFWKGKQPFRVRLETGPLAELIRATTSAHRVYELLLLDRPGDVWDYVWVVLEAAPQRVAYRVAHARQAVQPKDADGIHPWPDDRVPFKVFDSLFYYAWDDTEPEDEAWLNHRDSTLMRSFSQQALSIARAAQSRLGWNDDLLRHIASRVKSGDHPYCYLDRDVSRTTCREMSPNEALHTTAFYKKLSELLSDADLASVAYRAEGDYRVLRMMATEQRRRANLTGHDAGNALHLSALVNNKSSNEAWDSEIWFFDEGLAHGDLFIEGGGLGGGGVKALVESRYRVPGLFILSWRDEGSIDGFTAEAGEGWVLYRRQKPDTRRMALQRIQNRRRSKLGAVLSFADNGSTLFGYDKTVVVVGAEVSAAAQVALALTLTEWQRSGGDPLLVVIGDAAPFDRAGFEGVLSVPADAGDNESLAHWFYAELHRSRPWIDAVIALHAPEWATQVLADRLHRHDGPWPAWVVGTTGEPLLQVDQWLDGDLENTLLDAHRRAQGTRPQIL